MQHQFINEELGDCMRQLHCFFLRRLEINMQYQNMIVFLAFALVILLMIMSLTSAANDVDLCTTRSEPVRSTLRRNACNYMNLILLAREHELGVSEPVGGFLEFHTTSTTSLPAA